MVRQKSVVSHRSSFRRGSALIVALATAALPIAVAAQPLDPYAPAKAAPRGKAKGKADGKDKGTAGKGAPKIDPRKIVPTQIEPSQAGPR